MSFATARRDIEKRLADNWATTPIAYDNVAFDPPKDLPWVAIRIFEEPTERITIGSRGVHRVRGLVVVYMYTPKETGTATIRGYGDDIAAIYRDQQFSGITFESASIANVGDFEQWYQVNVAIPFYWDGVHTV